MLIHRATSVHNQLVQATSSRHLPRCTNCKFRQPGPPPNSSAAGMFPSQMTVRPPRAGIRVQPYSTSSDASCSGELDVRRISGRPAPCSCRFSSGNSVSFISAQRFKLPVKSFSVSVSAFCCADVGAASARSTSPYNAPSAPLTPVIVDPAAAELTRGPSPTPRTATTFF
jgi:hypothetical protein